MKICKMKLEHLVVAESKKMLRHTEMSKEHRSDLKKLPTAKAVTMLIP